MHLQSTNPVFVNTREGNRVFIPCFNENDQRIFGWKINGSLYPISELPPDLYLQESPNGILVEYTTLNTSGEFICYSYETSEHLQYISTVHLTIGERDQSSDTGT